MTTTYPYGPPINADDATTRIVVFGHWWDVGAASAGQTVVIGLNTEIDLAQPLGALKERAIGLNVETDTALSMTVLGVQIIPIGLTLETDLAQPMAHAKTRVLGLNVETDLALIITVAKARAIGLNTETNTSLAMTVEKQKTLGLTLETDLAQPITVAGPKTVIIGLVVEADTALAMTADSGVALEKLADPGPTTYPAPRPTGPRLYAKRWNMFAETFDAFLRRQETLVRKTVREIPVEEVPQAIIEIPEFQDDLREMRNVIQERMQVTEPEIVEALEPAIEEMALAARDEEDILAIVALIASDHSFLQ